MDGFICVFEYYKWMEEVGKGELKYKKDYYMFLLVRDFELDVMYEIVIGE